MSAFCSENAMIFTATLMSNMLFEYVVTGLLQGKRFLC
jgi:hypothetical protein